MIKANKAIAIVENEVAEYPVQSEKNIQYPHGLGIEIDL